MIISVPLIITEFSGCIHQIPPKLAVVHQNHVSSRDIPSLFGAETCMPQFGFVNVRDPNFINAQATIG